jgi:hypothetical protein
VPELDIQSDRGGMESRGNAVHVESCAAVVLLALMLIPPTNARAQAPADVCSLAPAAATPGVVWQGRERVGLREIAGLVAPVLWFSADEPLLAEGQPPFPRRTPATPSPTALSSTTRSPRSHIEVRRRSDGPRKTTRRLRTGSSPSSSSTTSTIRRTPGSGDIPTISRPQSSRCGSKAMAAVAACGSPRSRRSLMAAAGTRTP